MILRSIALLLCFVMSSRGSGVSFFWTDDDGALGVVPEAQRLNDGDASSTVSTVLAPAAAIALMKILQERDVATGDEELVFVRADASLGSAHLRYRESIHNLPVDLTSVVVHIRTTDGGVHAVNGEFVNSRDVAFPDDNVPGQATMDCETATRRALAESGIENGEWTHIEDEEVDVEGDGKGNHDRERGCGTQAIATDPRGRSHACWKRSVRYGGIRRDAIYASAITWELVARVPQVMTGAASGRGGSGGGGGGGGIAGGFAGGIR